jgi:predicted RNase H-like HicB family nuclease
MLYSSILYIEENLMNYPVIIRVESAHQYVAQPVGIPEVKVVAAPEAEAVAQVTEALGHWLAATKVIHVTIPGEAHDNPWLDTFGRSATDLDFPAREKGDRFIFARSSDQ